MSKRRISISQDVFIACRVGDIRWLEKVTSSDKERHHVVTVAKDKKGFSPIHIAAIECKLESLKYLVNELECDVNFTTKSGWTALHFTINNTKKVESLECMNYLLLKGANIDRATCSGMTGLHLASAVGHIDEVKSLLKRGATVDLKDISNKTAFVYATLWGHREVARLLAHHMWFKQKSDEKLSRQTFEKYSNDLRKKFEKEQENMKIMRQEGAETAFKEWHMKNDFIYNPYAFGQVAYDRNNCSQKSQEYKNTRVSSLRSVSHQPSRLINSKTPLPNGQTPRPHASFTRRNDRSMTFLPLSDFYKT